MIDSYKSFTKSLQDLGFDDFYRKNISNLSLSINYGKTKGDIQLESVLDAGHKYYYEANLDYEVSIDQPISIFKNGHGLDDRDVLITCIEIFDWGGVQKSNILSALSFHRKGELVTYLEKCMEWFEDESSLSEPDFEVIWSSGWTKVYSFMFDFVTIYDSRVAAFINKIFLDFYLSLDEDDRKKLKSVTSGLLSFGGTTKRARTLSSEYRRELSLYGNPSDKRKMVANKKASWFIRHISEVEGLAGTQSCFRLVDKAAFMLGFDLKQWNQSI